MTPGTMITASAIWPRVSSVTMGRASSMDAAVWVAPKSRAAFCLNSTGSTATMFRAPTILAPCTALMPTPPTPTTTTVSPGMTSARYTAEPQPVATPQDTRATAVERQVGVDRHQRGLVAHAVLGEGAQLGHHVEGLGRRGGSGPSRRRSGPGGRWPRPGRTGWSGR